jgi:hypothetical protein
MKMTVCGRAAQTHNTRVKTVKHFTEDGENSSQGGKFFQQQQGNYILFVEITGGSEIKTAGGHTWPRWPCLRVAKPDHMKNDEDVRNELKIGSLQNKINTDRTGYTD